MNKWIKLILYLHYQAMGGVFFIGNINMLGLLSSLNGAARRWQLLFLMGMGASQIGCQVLYASVDLFSMHDAKNDTLHMHLA